MRYKNLPGLPDITWHIDDGVPDNIIYIFSLDQFVIENGKILMKKDVQMTNWVRTRCLARMVRAFKEDKNPYYKICMDANDIICFRCGKPVSENCVSVKATSTTVSFRRYYDKECFDKLYQ